MPVTYFDKVLYLYPNIQRVMFWQQDPVTNQPFENPYDGLQWENTEIPKLSQEALDRLDDDIVEQTLATRSETLRKQARNDKYKDDLAMKALFFQQQTSNPSLTWGEFLDILEMRVVE